MAVNTDLSLRRQVIYSVFVRGHTKEGTFRALEGDLDRLKALGADILWLMPIHPIGEEGRKGTMGSPYAIRDYRAVNPDMGTVDDLWQDVQGYMHIIVSHEDLDEAEALMAQAKALSARGSTEELYPVLAQLRHQFRLIAETQQLSPKNIF